LEQEKILVQRECRPILIIIFTFLSLETTNFVERCTAYHTGEKAQPLQRERVKERDNQK